MRLDKTQAGKTLQLSKMITKYCYYNNKKNFLLQALVTKFPDEKKVLKTFSIIRFLRDLIILYNI